VQETATPPSETRSRASTEVSREPRVDATSEKTLAAPTLAADRLTSDGRRGTPFLLISLLVAISLLVMASAPVALARRPGGLVATALGYRTELAVGGAMLLLLSAIGFFLTA
ncbi:MAG: hypothetical protein ACR2OD_00295, partial [Gaiellaceae bacterium]